MTKRSQRLKEYSFCALSAALLVLAYPRTDFAFLAWGALVPLMLILDGKTPWAAFRRAFFCGFCFFAGTMFWFFHLTRWFSVIAAVGIMLLLMYLAVYFGLFGLCYTAASRRNPLFKVFFLPSAWVGLEYIRAHLFSGFDWASLGHSQYKNLALIQIADVTGVSGVSFLVLLANVLAAELILRGVKGASPRPRRNIKAAAMLTVAVFAGVWGYGCFRLSFATAQGRPETKLSIAVVQANTPQELKWQKDAQSSILANYAVLTEEAARQNPDLIIWPETSNPGYLWEDEEQFRAIRDMVRRAGIPLLFGSVLAEDGAYYNTAVLLSADGDVLEIHRKIHLVPFGEFLPLRRWFPFLARLVNIGDFTPGRRWTVFTADDKTGLGGLGPTPFSVLICFEDTVAELSRAFVRQGAGILVNMTNDAWFGDTKAPMMHLQSAVFRTVENRRSLVRAANSGVSCLIDDRGRIRGCVESPRDGVPRRTYVSGIFQAEAIFSWQKTFYTKYGDIFTFICFGCILWGIISGIRTKRR